MMINSVIVVDSGQSSPTWRQHNALSTGDLQGERYPGGPINCTNSRNAYLNQWHRDSTSGHNPGSCYSFNKQRRDSCRPGNRDSTPSRAFLCGLIRETRDSSDKNPRQHDCHQRDSCHDENNQSSSLEEFTDYLQRIIARHSTDRADFDSAS